jgi:hypothetical protein
MTWIFQGPMNDLLDYWLIQVTTGLLAAGCWLLCEMQRQILDRVGIARQCFRGTSFTRHCAQDNIQQLAAVHYQSFLRGFG